MMPLPVAPSSIAGPARPRPACTTKAATCAVAATHSQRRAEFLLPVGDRAQRDRHLEERLDDLFEAALADLMAAGQVAGGGGQRRADAVPAVLSGEGLPGDFAAARAEA